LYRYDTVQFFHPASHQSAKVNRRDEAVDLGGLVVVALDPRRVKTGGSRGSVARLDVEKFSDL
jgi:hypothetical protein